MTTSTLQYEPRKVRTPGPPPWWREVLHFFALVLLALVVLCVVIGAAGYGVLWLAFGRPINGS